MKNKVVHITQFYPCSIVELGVELQYIVELAKYLNMKKYTNHVLSVDGVEFSERLRKSNYWDYFRVAVRNGLIIDCNMVGIEEENLSYMKYKKFRNVFLVEEKVDYDAIDSKKRKEDIEYLYKIPEKASVFFAEKTPYIWRWTLGCNTVENTKTFNSTGSEVVWVSLIAYIAVQRFLTNEPEEFVIDIPNSVANTHMIMSALTLLLCETNCCVGGWCRLNYLPNVPNETLNQIGYQAWYYKGKDLGLLSGWYSSKEKQEYMNELDMQVGDVVYLYERKFGQKLDFVKSLEGFHVAIIRDIDEDGVLFDIVNNKKTKAQGEYDYSNYTTLTKQMYDFKNPFNKQNVTRKRILWFDLGVEYKLHGEVYFIVNCDADDGKMQYIGGAGNNFLVMLNSAELTYWILKDYGYDFNVERYVTKNIGKEPLYDMYNRTGFLPDKYIVR